MTGTKQRRVRVVDAFTDEPLAGNAAGIVPDGEGVSDEEMQAIARELAVSETAFLLPSERADRRVRYFTPTQEIDLCGHATIASHVHLFEDDVLEAGTHSLETNVGVLEIEVEDDGTVWMTQDDPEIRRVELDYDRVADVLGVDPAGLEELEDEISMAVSSTGVPFLLVPAAYLENVGDANPDMVAVEDLCEEVDATGIYLYTFDALESDSTLHGRAFVPLAGVPEDPVTGTASGAVAAYLDHVGAFDRDFPDELVLEQGHFVDRPGRVRVRVEDRVRVGGRGAVAVDGTLSVPDIGGDDIIEV
ncbi:MAG: PhzF family phenazine biosynthesis protein [archaeon]